jgi:hypothetical protein
VVYILPVSAENLQLLKQHGSSEKLSKRRCRVKITTTVDAQQAPSDKKSQVPEPEAKSPEKSQAKEAAAGGHSLGVRNVLFWSFSMK